MFGGGNFVGSRRLWLLQRRGPMEWGAIVSGACWPKSLQAVCAVSVYAVLTVLALTPRAAAAEPGLPTVGGYGGENLAIGVYWGLSEEPGAEAQNSIGVVGAPMPFVMQLEDNQEDRLFVYVQHSVAGGGYCAETPAGVEHVSVALTAPEGDQVNQGGGYDKTYLWTPTEAGEYALCAYLDASAEGHPAETNFLKLTAEPAPGQLQLAVAPQTETTGARITVSGAAVVPSELTLSTQERGLPCTLPEGQLAGQPLAPSVVGSDDPAASVDGAFGVSFEDTTAKPGSYEACAYLVPESTPLILYRRPYEIGMTDFVIAESVESRVSSAGPGTSSRVRPPQLTDVGMSRRRFHAGRGTARSVRSTTISKVLTASAHSGQRKPAATAASRLCTRNVAIGSIVKRNARAGVDVVPFAGSVAHRMLSAGYYAAAVTAYNANGSAGVAYLHFTILP
jgi:hypothetical protein